MTLNESHRHDKAIKLAEKLARFHLLPNEALVSIDVVCALRERSKASIWRDVKAGRFPAPVKSTGLRCTRWLVGDLRNA